MPLISSYPILSAPVADDLIPIIDSSDLNPTTNNPKLKNVTLSTLTTALSEGISPLSTKGEIWVYGTTDTSLSVGTNAQVLTADSSQTTGLKWSTLGSAAYLNAGTTATPNNVVQLDALGKLPELDGSALTGISAGLTSPLTTSGDIWIFTTTDTRLPRGNEGEVLSSTATGLDWIPLPSGITSPLTATGDLWYKNNVGNDAALPRGATYQQLVATNSNIEWSYDSGTAVDLRSANFSPTTTDNGKLFVIDTTTGNITVDLDGLTGSIKKNYYFYNIGINQVTFVDAGSTFIGDPTLSQHEFVRLISASSNSWYVIKSVASNGTVYQSFSTAKTASFSLAESDHGAWIPCTNTTAIIVTLPVDFPDGFQCIIDRQNTGDVVFSNAVGTTLVSNSTEITAQYGVVHAVVNNNVWRLTGAL